jgi:hypothetical protein
MGYTTDFDGEFELDKPLSEEHLNYLNAFAYIRHMRRDPSKLINKEDLIRELVGLPLGEEGEFYVGSSADAGGNFKGQHVDDSVIDNNYPPKTQPGLWCQWIPTEDGESIEWDGGEKFYYYVEWLRYIIEKFLKPWGYILNGTVRWRGEGFDDIGVIRVENNQIQVDKPSW